MAERYLKVDTDGITAEQEASVSSAGASDAGKIVALDPNGKLDDSLFPTGFGAEGKILPAFEAITAGSFVNIFVDTIDANKLKVRKADASSPGKQSDGFVLDSVNEGEDVLIYAEGVNNQITGLTPGVNYFLSSTTPGTASTTVPSANGTIVQCLGKSVSTTEILVETRPIIKRPSA